jgi:hypothetical protein
LGHPPAIRVLAKNEAKADRMDADRFGRFWLRGIFPESYLSTPEVRQLRERLRYRMALVQLRTGVKSRVQAILHRQGVLHDYSDLFGKGGRAFLTTLALPAACRAALDGWLALIDLLDSHLADVEAWMQQHLEEDEITRDWPDPGPRDSSRGGTTDRALSQPPAPDELLRPGSFG